MAKEDKNRQITAILIAVGILITACSIKPNNDVFVNEDLSYMINSDSDAFLKKYPFFSLSGSDIILEKNTYDINDTIVVPKGFSLEIEAGSTLRFSKGKSLISYSTVSAKGTESSPIMFIGQNSAKWGSLGIVGAGKSAFEHVKFENSEGSRVNNQEFMGSMSLVESDAEIINSEFSNLFGKDGVWALNSDVIIRNNIFKDILVDCLDLDNGSGEVSGNQFINCGDEGIDLSESNNVKVFGNVIINAGNGIDADANLEEIRKLNEIKS